MANAGQKTEQPTQRRLDRARREGNFPSSREFVSSIYFLCFAITLVWFGGSYLLRITKLMRRLITLAFAADLNAARSVTIARQIVAPDLLPLAYSGAAILVIVVLAQLATTRMGWSFHKLAPDPQRLNPLKRLSSLPSQNLFLLTQAVLLLAAVGLALYREITENLNPFLELPWLAPPTAAARIGGALRNLMWRAAGVFLVIGVIDLIWNRRRYTRQLRMTKQEVREELKEQESSPHVKARIRRI
jgi:flagellar biosynthetic protein FlhB